MFVNPGDRAGRSSSAIARLGGACVLIGEQVSANTAASVGFIEIPQDFRDLEIRIRGRGTTAATLIDIRLRFNGDTGANYDNESVQGQGTTAPISFNSRAQASNYIGNIAASTATADVSDLIKVMVGDYRGQVFQKVSHYEATLKTGTAAASNNYREMGSNWWRSKAAIYQVTVFPSAGAFVDGTVVSLYGWY